MQPQRFQLARHRAWLQLVSSGLVAIFGLTVVWTPVDVFAMPDWPGWVRAAVLIPFVVAMVVNATDAILMLRSDPTIVILTADTLAYRYGWRQGEIAFQDIEKIEGTRAAARIHRAGHRTLRLDLGMCEPALSVHDLREWVNQHA